MSNNNKWKHNKKLRELLALFISEELCLAVTNKEIGFIMNNPDTLSKHKYNGPPYRESLIAHAIRELKLKTEE